MVRAAPRGAVKSLGGAAVAVANRRLFSAVLIVALAATVASGCGRKGPLDPPTAAVVTSSGAPAVTPDKPAKPFVLDPLIK